MVIHLKQKKKIGIIGDVIIDKYKYFKATKLSPEGPAPIVKALSESVALGGAANVAISLANLGINLDLIIADTKENEIIQNLVNQTNNQNFIQLKKISFNNQVKIPIKIRYYVDGKQFMREDLEKNEFPKNDPIDDYFLEKNICDYELIIISDYQKGVISKNAIKKIISYCNAHNIPLFIDTKMNESKYIKNAYCIKINDLEFNNIFHEYKLNFEESTTSIKNKLELARKSINIKNLILTLGSRGSFLSTENDLKNMQTESVDVVDITGAGDAFLAGLVYSFIQNKPEKIQLKENLLIEENLIFANQAAGSVIKVKGTAPIQKKFLDNYRKNILGKKTIGFTNGCFDLLHIGHLSLFEEAKKYCDYLIVGLNSDSSVKKIKGNHRPINDEKTRFEILKSIRYIDEVIIFNEETPLKIIKEISPKVLIKGSDYEESEIVGADYVKNYGGKVIRVNLIPNQSTSKIVKEIIQQNKKNN